MRKIATFLALVFCALALPVDAQNFNINRGNIATNRMQARTTGAQPSFVLNFRDLGAGAVDTTAERGAVAATFTRAGATATTISSTGLVLKAIGANVARSYYDPTTLTYLGYLAEGARTNLALQSEDFATTWSNNGSTESTNVTTAPDGTATADKLQEDNANSNHSIQQAITYTNAAHTASVWIKASERSFAWVNIFDGTTNFGKFYSLSGTGSVLGDIGSGGTATITAYPASWYRVTITATTAAAAGNVNIGASADGLSTSYLGTTGSGIFLWGGQVELGGFASTYVPTTVATVARNADVLSYPFTGTSGTLIGVGTYGGATTVNQAILQISDGTNANRTVMYRGATVSLMTAQTDVASVSQAVIVPAGAVNSATAKFAYAFNTNDFQGANNGVLGTADVAGTLPAITILHIGDTASGSAPMFGAIPSVKYFPPRLPNGLLQNFTRQ